MHANCHNHPSRNDSQNYFSLLSRARISFMASTSNLSLSRQESRLNQIAGRQIRNADAVRFQASQLRTKIITGSAERRIIWAELFSKIPALTCSPPVFSGCFAVNNSRVKIAKAIDFTGESELFTHCSPRVFGG